MIALGAIVIVFSLLLVGVAELLRRVLERRLAT